MQVMHRRRAAIVAKLLKQVLLHKTDSLVLQVGGSICCGKQMDYHFLKNLLHLSASKQ